MTSTSPPNRMTVTCRECGLVFSAEHAEVGFVGIRPKADAERCRDATRDSIECALKREAREEDERLVARLVEQRRRERNAADRARRGAEQTQMRAERARPPSTHGTARAPNTARSEDERVASQNAVCAHERELADAETARVSQQEELRRMRHVGAEIGGH